MNVGGNQPFVGTDVRLKSCARCGREYLPGRGSSDGMCSSACWVRSRGRQASQGETLGRSWQAGAERREATLTGNYRVSRLLAGVAEQTVIAEAKRNRHRDLEVIERAQARSRGEAVRSGPTADCPRCESMGASPREIAQICRHRGGGAEAQRGRRPAGQAGEYRVPPYSEFSGPAMIRVTTPDGSYAPDIYR